MKTLLILGAGTGGTMVANKMTNLLDTREWRIVIVDKEETHYYQPGFLFIPFGIYQPTDVVKPKSNFFPKSAEVIYADIELIEPEKNQVKLSGNKTISYDYLVVATGSHIHPEETDGMMDGWQKNVFDFYTPQGAANLHKFFETWDGGRLVLNVAEMPIKCPVAPLEFLFLADWYFNKRGIRNKVELTFATPLSGAFTKPVASKMLGNLMESKGISVVPDFNIMEVDNSKNIIRSYDEIEVHFDVFVSIPVNKGADVIGASGMGDSLNFIPTNKNTLQTEKWENIFIIGDAGDVPSSKAGSVAHFMLDILVDNMLDHMKGHEMKASFDGHANCFIESGYNKGLLIDFNFEVEPLPGTFPFAGVGPFRLLQESYLNHIGKMGFRWIYWNILLKGYDLPFVETHMSMNGKQVLVQEPA